MPSVNLLEQLLTFLDFWQTLKQHYLNTPVDLYTQQYISERLAECDQRIAEIQVLINENLVAWAARRPQPPQQ